MDMVGLLCSGLSLGRGDVGELSAEGLQADVDQVADVTDAVPADPADLLVGEAVLELQADHLALAGREGVEKLEGPGGRLATLGDLGGSRVGTGPDRDLFLAELCHSTLLPQDVE